jgi:hypothetical protein
VARACKHIVPEGQPKVVNALVIARFTERARRALATCLTCSEPIWAEAVNGWEALDRDVSATVNAARAEYVASRWPVAGDGAVEVPADLHGLTLVELPASARTERVRYAVDDAGAARVGLIARGLLSLPQASLPAAVVGEAGARRRIGRSRPAPSTGSLARNQSCFGFSGSTPVA